MSFFLKDEEGKLLYKQDYSESDFRQAGYRANTFTVELPFGKIQTTQWFFDGIRISYSEAQLNNPIVLAWDSDTEIVTLYFNLLGRILVTDTENNISVDLYGNRHNIFYGREATGIIKIEELKLKSLMVQLSKESFLKLSNNNNDALKQFSNKVATGNPAIFSAINLPIDFEIQNCINQVVYCPYGDELKPMFLFSKVLELLVLQAESYNRAQTQTSTVIKTEYDYERIIFARDYLIKNIDFPPSLPELARIAGINEFKLKKGFKETFNQSVFQYLSNTRLETAKIHLLDGSKSATELAFELGYSSVQHFSTAFKKKFGVPPNQLRK